MVYFWKNVYLRENENAHEACTTGQTFGKMVNGYPIFSVQIIYHQVDKMHK